MILKTILIAGLACLTSAGAHATTLLDLVNAPDQVDTPYSFDIVATSSSLTLSFGGYQVPGVQVTNYISLSTTGGSNLLGQTWDFTPAPVGSWAWQLPDSTSVNALVFYGEGVGSYDIFSQTIAATAGTTYRLAFLFFADSVSRTPVNGLRVTTDGTLAAPVPEPASWALMIGGFATAGGVLRRRRARLRFA